MPNVRCNNRECPVFDKCQRPLDFDENHIKASARYIMRVMKLRAHRVLKRER